MEESVASTVMVSCTIHSQNIAFAVNIPCIEELVVIVARLATARHVRPNVVESTEASREVDMSAVAQTR
jgi:hypothetical protein